jgi:hypothetical protein
VDEFSIVGRRQFMEIAIATNLDPTKTLGIRGLGHCKYWLMGAWSKSKSPYASLLGLVALGLERLGSATWGGLVLMIIYMPTLGSNVISLMSSIIILGGLTSGLICISKVLFNVCCAFDSRMTIRVNGVFTIIGGSISMELIDCMDMS